MSGGNGGGTKNLPDIGKSVPESRCSVANGLIGELEVSSDWETDRE